MPAMRASAIVAWHAGSVVKGQASWRAERAQQLLPLPYSRQASDYATAPQSTLIRALCPSFVRSVARVTTSGGKGVYSAYYYMYTW